MIKKSKNIYGFTLIELIVTISIILLTTGAGIAGFVSFNERQQVQTTVNELKNYMKAAQVKARAGEGANDCDDSTTPEIEKLYGYRVATTVGTDGEVLLIMICKNSSGSETKNEIHSRFSLDNVTITKKTPSNSSSNQNVNFLTLGGGIYIGNNEYVTYTVTSKYTAISYEFQVLQNGEITEGGFL